MIFYEDETMKRGTGTVDDETHECRKDCVSEFDSKQQIKVKLTKIIGLEEKF